jgi:hypothetical protein
LNSICLSTLKLVEVSGERVSEITTLVIANDKKMYPNSIFAAYSAMDFTSIWAAALETKENLVSGMPQAANDGAAIVGLLAS